MNDGPLLLRAIIDNPAEDTPRLMYADWLQENRQDEHAGYIRSSIAVPQQFAHVFPPGAAAMTILHRREGGHLVPVPILHASPMPGVSYTVRRGFVESVTCTAADWLAHGDAISREHPITQVRLTTWPEVGIAGSLRRTFWLEGDPEPLLFYDWEVIKVAAHRHSDNSVIGGPAVVAALLSLRYPGITFHLPRATT
jgi:uncharacterized protein (TIGR02996 family)